jgi:RecA/RadA recombinase
MAGPVFNLGKVLKDVSKIDGVFIGTYDPHTWLSTGNYALNFFLAQDFYKAVPFGKVMILAGEPAAGKSYISANIAKEAQREGITVVMIDTEGALDDKWLRDVGIDPENNFMRIEARMIGQVAEIMNSFIEQYKADNKGKKPEEKQRVLFVLDSLGMLSTPIAVEQFKKGDLKGDMGHKPKQLKQLVTQIVSQITGEEIGMIMTNHSYASQDMYNPEPKLSGGDGPIYAASIIVAMRKKNLKDDSKKSIGIKSVCKVFKSRYAKPNELTEIDIPYVGGLDPYSGLLDLLKDKKAIQQNGAWYAYTDLSGKVHKYQEKGMTPEFFHLIMDEWKEQEDRRYGSGAKDQKLTTGVDFDPETGEILEDDE